MTVKLHTENQQQLQPRLILWENSEIILFKIKFMDLQN